MAEKPRTSEEGADETPEERLAKLDAHLVERSNSTPEIREMLTRRLLRETQVWTDNTQERLPGRWSGKIIQAACGEHTHDEFYFEQARPLMESLIEEGFIIDTQSLRGVILTADGISLARNFEVWKKGGEFRRSRLPWLEEGWE